MFPDFLGSFKGHKSGIQYYQSSSELYHSVLTMEKTATKAYKILDSIHFTAENSWFAEHAKVET